MAQLILNIPDADIPRVQEAFGVKIRGQGGAPATTTEVKQDVQQYMKDVCVNYENRKAIVQLPPPVPIDIT